MRSIPLSPPSMVRRRFCAALIAATLFASYFYFYQGTGWNQNSHFDLARVLLEQHTVSIDRYQRGTGDKAFYNGHYYSDKAPGLSLLSLPAVSAAVPLAAELHVRGARVADVQLYLATVFTCSLAIALAATVMFFVLLEWNFEPGAAAFAAVVLGLGTPMWVYATEFWGHALASACLVFAFAAADRLRSSSVPGRSALLAAFVGLSAGWAVVSEYPAAIPAVLIGMMALIYCWRSLPNKKSFLFAAAALCFTAGLCLAVILAYQQAAFGSPFRLGYEYVVNYQDTLHHGALGVTYPKLHPLLALLFGKRCGLLLFTPVLAAAPLGFYLLWRAGAPRLSLGVSAGIALYYVLFNASYLHWQAGASFGPRYLSPGLPFACLLLAPVWQRARPALKAVLTAAASFGVAVALAGATSFSMISESIGFSIREALRALARGQLYQKGGAWNLGSLAGLHGWEVLFPLLAMWLVAALIWWRLASSRGQMTAAVDGQHASAAMR